MRKKVDGEVRNRDRTKEKLINAVGEILANEGHAKLSVNNIARKAMVDKKLIYRYFGGAKELVCTYLRERDFWTKLVGTVPDTVDLDSEDHGKGIAKLLLNDLLDYLQHMDEARKILLWEISQKDNNLVNLNQERELLGEDLFSISDPFFENATIDSRACYAILLGGVNYISLHAKATGGKFCTIDANQKEGTDRIRKALEDMIELIYNVPYQPK